ncbi:MAG TPA: DNA polymerase III subunit alpha [Streptosporangiaceae bacterium]|nr:DNA polymerase III subunit alpha [Streptosporangiaceae bacterium]
MDPFIHLRTASAYSLRYGVTRPDALVRQAAEFGMDALALTDRDGLYGAVKHLVACEKYDVRPILGVDLELAGGGRVVALAVGRRGWASLCRLVSATHLSGPRAAARTGGAGRRPGHGPVTTPELIAEHAAGLVVLLGPASDVGQAIAARRPDLAAARLAAWRERAGDVAVEIVDHQGKGESHRAARMLALAKEAGLPAVLSNAVRYLDPGDSPVTHVLDASRKLVPLHRRHLDDLTGQAYFKSGKEMAQVAELICGPDRDAAGELFVQTRRLAERCVLDPEADLGLGRTHLPEVPAGAPGAAGAAGGRPATIAEAFAMLRARCAEGLVRRGYDRDARARERLAHELGIIERRGLASYFLVVADVAALIRSYGIRCAIRGSGAGCLVNYLLGIGDLDPLRHELIMERFLADSREGLPDIDLDVESARRLEAYHAIFDKYGDDRVACVSMLETYRARSAIRDVGAAVGLPPAEIDAIAKAFPHVRARRLGAALRDLPELRDSGLARLAEGRLAGLFRLAERLDGLPRHVALHPCGVLLSDVTLRDRTPVEKSLLGFPMSQYDKDDVEDMGLLKLDVIGVRMQSAMAHTVAEISRVSGGRERVDLEEVPADDEPTYELIRTSRTLGCFQIESPGQRELVAKLGPRTMADLVIDISLFRPGPVNSDMITPFLEARHGRRRVEYPHPALAAALAESNGVVVFHEQVLRIIDVMTGCGLSTAEWQRRRLGDDTTKDDVEAWFRDESRRNGYDAAVVDRVWAALSAFGAFGFCKAHAASFALPTYQSAWLKRHHPAAFFAGVLTHDPGMYPKRAILDDARHFAIPILPLDVNRSAATWRVEPIRPPIERPPGVLGIRVALAEVKGISEAEVARVVAGQPYVSLGDFWRRARVSRPVAERLALVGAFDSLPGVRQEASRRDLMCQVGALDRAGGRLATGQLPLAPSDTDLWYDYEVPAGGLPKMTLPEMIEAELEILGMDVTAHVLSCYDELLAGLGVVRARDLPRCRARDQVLVAGVKIATQTPAVRSGQRIIFATVDDATGPVDVTFFESVQDRCAATVFGSWLLVIRGTVRRAGGRAVSINATACWDLAGLYEAWRTGGLAAARAAMAVPDRPRVQPPGGAPITYANGYRISPYADVAPAGGAVKHPPRALWHASGGSSGGFGRPDDLGTGKTA